MIRKLQNIYIKYQITSLRGLNKAVWWLLVFALFFSIPLFAAAPSVAVIYPELRAPYNKIFDDIADGVEKKVNGRTKRFALPKDYSKEQLNNWFKKKQYKSMCCVRFAWGKCS